MQKLKILIVLCFSVFLFGCDSSDKPVKNIVLMEKSWEERDGVKYRVAKYKGIKIKVPNENMSVASGNALSTFYYVPKSSTPSAKGDRSIPTLVRVIIRFGNDKVGLGVREKNFQKAQKSKKVIGGEVFDIYKSGGLDFFAGTIPAHADFNGNTFIGMCGNLLRPNPPYTPCLHYITLPYDSQIRVEFDVGYLRDFSAFNARLNRYLNEIIIER
jgi:hypothetical protein